ncbi:MAG: ABC-type transport auxiliary lipoprotein family protein [Candidatus Cloacimonetes bacterium]|nr:ABC-type transport auxiliary lipoprotein family protein [Candidatus Cloacimonadota bacterium]
MKLKASMNSPRLSRIILSSLSFALLVATLLLSGCFGGSERIVTNYYILDYLRATERAELKLATPYNKTLEIYDTTIPRTYNRNQLVVKENFTRIKYLPNELWANRLYDSVPNLILQRIKAYNVFQRAERDLGGGSPDYFLETNLLNIERVDEDIPYAHIRIEFFMRDALTNQVIITHRADRTRPLNDPSIVYLVQVLNEIILDETDVFVAKCIDTFEGTQSHAEEPLKTLPLVKQYIQEQTQIVDETLEFGELNVPLITYSSEPMQYNILTLDESYSVVNREYGEFNLPTALRKGNYRLILDENENVTADVEILPNMRTVVTPQWCELTVVIMDESQTKVRMNYDIWRKNEDEKGFDKYNQWSSVGDDEIGVYNRIWILPAGNYMIKLQGGSWNDYRDFTTINLNQGDSKTLTVIVNPLGERTFLIGAGDLGDDDLEEGKQRIHQGAIHTNISLISDNTVDKNKPTYSFTLSGQFDNRIEADFYRFHYNMRSIYDLGMNIASDQDFKISIDDYSLKNTLLFMPFEKRKVVKNLGLYGRADMSTRLFDEFSNFSDNKNYILIKANGDTLGLYQNESSIRTKVAFFPMKLREGTGITYRFYLGPNINISLRGGYGWAQEYKKRSFVKETSNVTIQNLDYEVYKEEEDIITRGYESTLIISALNLFKTISLTSTFDVLFPMETIDKNAKFTNDNRINIKLFRNVSLDIKALLYYDQSNKTQDYLMYEYSSFLRLSLYY